MASRILVHFKSERLQCAGPLQRDRSIASRVDEELKLPMDVARIVAREDAARSPSGPDIKKAVEDVADRAREKNSEVRCAKRSARSRISRMGKALNQLGIGRKNNIPNNASASLRMVATLRNYQRQEIVSESLGRRLCCVRQTLGGPQW